MSNTKIQKKKKFKVIKKPENKSQRAGYNNEIYGLLLIAFSVLMFMSIYFTNTVGAFGKLLRQMSYGISGISSVFIPFICGYWGVALLFNLKREELKVKTWFICILLILISALVETGNYNPSLYINLDVYSCIKLFYSNNSVFPQKGIGGGVIGGIIAMPLVSTFQTVGAIIVLATISLIVSITLTNVSIAAILRNVARVASSFIKNAALKISKILKAISGNRVKNDSEVYHSDNESNDMGFESFDNDFNLFNQDKKNRKEDQKYYNKNKNEYSNTSCPEQYCFEDGNNNIINSNNHHKFEHKNCNKTDENKQSNGVEESEQQTLNNRVQPQIEEFTYNFPPVSILRENIESAAAVKNHKIFAVESAKKLEETLACFGVAAKVVNISRGPSVTRFELEPSKGVKVSRIVSLSDDIALNLAAPGVRIEAPIPGKAAIGIEVPNKEITTVSLREVIESQQFLQHSSKLCFALGKDISGECVVADIAKMPHLLIAGATGSGKSVCINSLIISLLYKASPSEVKLLMIDPKVVELGIYNGIPHLLIPVVTEPKKAAGALNWAVQEMINRYKLFAENSVRDIRGYNEMIKQNGNGSLLPHIVIIIDELADLMMIAPNDVEDAICRLAQMARAAGMHLVIATQRPSVDVITGVIKANVPSRISFAVSSQVDSRTILDMAGAEKLLGRGDMLFYPVGMSKPVRIQGAFVSDEEVEKVVDYVKRGSSCEYDENIIEKINVPDAVAEKNNEDNDELLPKAIELVIDAGQASVSLIQRKFKVGYARAARIIDQMEARGIIGPYEGSKPRQILITKQELQEMMFSSNIISQNNNNNSD